MQIQESKLNLYFVKTIIRSNISSLDQFAQWLEGWLVNEGCGFNYQSWLCSWVAGLIPAQIGVRAGGN